MSTENQFKSTAIYGKFKNVDSTDGTILADANFKRDLTIQNNLIIGNEILDSSNNVISTNGSIIFTINKIIYTLPILTLSYLNSITSNVQNQINTINTTIQNLNGATNSNIINFTVSLNGMTTTTFNYLKNVSSDVQTQLNDILTTLSNKATLTLNNTFTGQNTFLNGLSIKYGSSNNAFLINNTTGEIDTHGNGVFNFWNNANYFQIYNNGSSINFYTSYPYLTINTDLNITSALNVSGNINNISSTVFSYLSGVSSNIQTQINNIISSISNIFTQNNSFTGINTFTTINFTTLNNISSTTFSYLSGVSSNIQTQFNNIITSLSDKASLTANNTFSGITTFNNRVYQNLSDFNTQFGANTLLSNTTGYRNTSFGAFSLQSNTTGNSNTAMGDQSLWLNSTGTNNTAIGHSSQSIRSTGDCNTSIGSSSLYNNTTGSYNTCIGNSSDVLNNSSFSTAIGYSTICTADHQIVIGTSAETIDIPGNIYTAGQFTANGASQFNQNVSIASGKNLTLTNGTINTSGSIIFGNLINNISTTTFSYLSGATSNIQSQLNYLFTAVNPVGSIIFHVGLTTTVSGYLYCDGSEYLKSTYPTLYSIIGDQFGIEYTPSNSNYFRIPNYKAVFLRGAGNRTIETKNYMPPVIGITNLDSNQLQYSSIPFVNNITVSKKKVMRDDITGVTIVEDITNTKSNVQIGDPYNNNLENAPIHSCVNYFIKY